MNGQRTETGKQAAALVGRSMKDDTHTNAHSESYNALFPLHHHCTHTHTDKCIHIHIHGVTGVKANCLPLMGSSRINLFYATVLEGETGGDPLRRRGRV